MKQRWGIRALVALLMTLTLVLGTHAGASAGTTGPSNAEIVAFCQANVRDGADVDTVRAAILSTFQENIVDAQGVLNFCGDAGFPIGEIFVRDGTFFVSPIVSDAEIVTFCQANVRNGANVDTVRAQAFDSFRAVLDDGQGVLNFCQDAGFPIGGIFVREGTFFVVSDADIVAFCQTNVRDGAAVDDVRAQAFTTFLVVLDDGQGVLNFCQDAGFPTGDIAIVDGRFVIDELPEGPSTGGGGSVSVGGNDNENAQNNDQDQTQEQTQDQGVEQGNANALGQGNQSDASAGSGVDNGCDASQVGDDDLGDDSVECESGDASTGDASVGDSNQANSGSQSGSNDTDQTGDQTGGNQANAPSNTADQTIDADVSDIGGDDNDVDNSDSINGNTGTIDQSNDTGVIEGDDNEVGDPAALSALISQLIALLIALFDTPDDNGGLPVTITLVSCDDFDGDDPLTANCTLTTGDSVRCEAIRNFDAQLLTDDVTCEVFGDTFDCGQIVLRPPTVPTPRDCTLVA